MASKNIVSVLHEERTFPPAAEFTARARVKPADFERMRHQAEADPSAFWAELARRELAWQTPFTVSLDASTAPNYRWFTDGRLNVSFNCLDVHLAERGAKTAIIFEGEPGDTRRLSYRELHADVCRFANALKAQGVRKGDRVAIYLPLVPEAVVAMHACNRIGAIHSVVFGGFSAPALKDRIEDTGAKVLITADGGWRGGTRDRAQGGGGQGAGRGLRHHRARHRPRAHRRVRADAARAATSGGTRPSTGQSPDCEPEWVEAEHPLYLLYTSGSTGKPKGIQHSSGGYLLGAKLTTQWVFDLRDDDVFWCTADVGWVTGHSYVAYGPLAAGATVVLYEGAPTFPDGGRFWKICQDHGVSVFYTAPTAIRALMKLGDEIPARYDLSRLRLLGSVGEPINPEAWMWYQRVIGRGRCPIVDTWWQTETGVILISPLPGVTATKPGSCTLPLPGIEADIVDERGEPVTRARCGRLSRDQAALAVDAAHHLGRQRALPGRLLGEIRQALLRGGRQRASRQGRLLLDHGPHRRCAERGRPPARHHGDRVRAGLATRGSRRPPSSASRTRSRASRSSRMSSAAGSGPTGDTTAVINELRAWVGEHLGAIAKPDEIRFADNLPKTRSGKIMRRLLRSIARGEEITQDVSTLENPAILDQLRGADAPVAAAPRAKPSARGGSHRRAAGARRKTGRATTEGRRQPGTATGRRKAAKGKTQRSHGRKSVSAARAAKRGGSRSRASGRRAPVKGTARAKPASRTRRKARAKR